MQVNLLIRVHHRNLTTLVGYCKDGTNAGLIYEYMANGNLHKHLSGLAYLLEYIFLFFRIRLIKWQRKSKATNQLPATFVTVPNNYTYWLLKTSTQTESFSTINTCNTNLNSHRIEVSQIYKKWERKQTDCLCTNADHISSYILNWEDRLRIAIDAAHGQQVEIFIIPSLHVLFLIFSKMWCEHFFKLRIGVSSPWL